MEEERTEDVVQDSAERNLDCCGSPKQSPKSKQKKKTKSSETLGIESPRKWKGSIFTKLGHKLLQSHRKTSAQDDLEDNLSRSMESLHKLLDDRIDSPNGARSASETSIFTNKKVSYDTESNDGTEERLRSYPVSPLLGRSEQGASTVRHRHRLERQPSAISVNSKLGESESTRERSHSGDVIPVVSEDSNFLVFECNDKLEQVKCFGG